MMEPIKPISRITDDVVEGKHKCFVCRKEFSWIAIVKGKHTQDIVEKVFKADAFANAVAYNTGVWNKNKAAGAELEIYVNCPDCNCKNKLSSRIITWKTDH